MGQVSKFLRRAIGGFMHWCPGCGEVHRIPDTWVFNGDVERPSFSPSVKITGKQKVLVEGKWAGGYVRDDAGAPRDMCCHYFLTAGELRYCGDSTHALAGQNVPLPELPTWLKDEA